MRRFFIEPRDVTDSVVKISGSDAKHLRNVLRVSPGQTIGLYDGAGFEYEAEIVTASPAEIEINIIKKSISQTESNIDIAFAQAFLKDKKMDTLVRQLTELGMNNWVPFMASRSVPRPDKKRLASRKSRWEKIAKESLKQCERGMLPVISDTLSFEGMLDKAAKYDLKVIFWENDTHTMGDLFPTPETVKSVFLVLGPEGGFSTEEIDAAKKSGFISVSLGPRILKSETAAVASLSIIQHFFGDMK